MAAKLLPSTALKLFLLFLILATSVLILTVYATRRIDRFAFLRAPAALCPGGGVSRWTRPPASAAHRMTDEELFWAASFVPQVARPFETVPKVAFMFLTRGPLPLAALWERFFAGQEGRFSVYIHALPSYDKEFPPPSVFHGRMVPSKVAEWGRMSMCDAERRLLANALLDLSNERFVLLSESCIPLYNFTIIYQYLTGSQHSFVGTFDDPGPHGRGRYNPLMEPLVNLTQWRKGAQWFEVNRKMAINLISDTKYYLNFQKFCKPPCYVDEHYFPTMLNIESPHLIANRSVTWVDWSRGGPHPAAFGKSDVTEAFLKGITEGRTCLYDTQPSSVCFLFARKFAPSALEPLLQLAPSSLGFG